MCGIVGYVGPKSTLEVLIGGLRRLEYRGYDSAGVSIIANGQIETRNKAGKLNNLVAEIEAHPLPTAHIGIGHTRWATHGAPTDGNAHPHLGGATSKLSLIHNGIIENFAELKAELLASGTKFASETDSEVAAHLIAKAFERTGDLVTAFTEVVNRLQSEGDVRGTRKCGRAILCGACQRRRVVQKGNDCNCQQDRCGKRGGDASNAPRIEVAEADPVPRLQAAQQDPHDQIPREGEEDVGSECGAGDLQAGMRRHHERYGEAAQPFDLGTKRGFTRLAGGVLHACSMGHGGRRGCAKVRA